MLLNMTEGYIKDILNR